MQVAQHHNLHGRHMGRTPRATRVGVPQAGGGAVTRKEDRYQASGTGPQRRGVTLDSDPGREQVTATFRRETELSSSCRRRQISHGLMKCLMLPNIVAAGY